jgi:translation initiation factor 4A
MATEKKDAEQGPRDHDAFDDDTSGIKIFPSFDNMDLPTNLLRGIYLYGFEKPSAIQQRAVVPFIKGGDIIAQAQSGTGKTGAFAIGLLARMDFNLKGCQALVLSPTRELAQQTEQVVSHIGHFLGENMCHAFVGGTKVQDDMVKLQSGCVVVAVGTPGRVFDVIKRTYLRTDTLKCLVLDEADEMLSQGFNEQIYQIFKYLPRDIQVALFSATMPEEVLELTKKFMRDPTRILVKQERLTLEGIKQFYIALDEEHKLEVLIDLYETVSVAQSVIFVNTRKKADWLGDTMNKKEFTVSVIHSDMDKADREKVMATFKSGSSRVLIATDLVARGIDVQHVSIVINFDLPQQNKETYLHRIGRSGRYGKTGVAINFVTEADTHVLKELEQHYGTKIDELPMDFAEFLDKSGAS